LQYFATKRKLNFRQASWNEFIAPFRYILHYRPGKQNLIADLLLRKAQNLVTQKAIKNKIAIKYCFRLIISLAES
jgi:hypothetical protein